MEEKHKTSSSAKQSGAIWIGVIFILGGIIVLLDQLNLLPFELNWWALFILMPAGGFFMGAYNRYRSTGNALSLDVTFPALIGLFLAALSFSMLVGETWNINWSLFWPIILILIGLGMVFGWSRRT